MRTLLEATSLCTVTLLFVAWQPMLAGFVGLLLFARLEAGDVANHPKRQRILDIVRRTPGITPLRLCASTGFGWGTTMHHINKLQRTGHLTSVSAGRTRALFLPGLPVDVRRQAALVQRPEHVALLNLLQKRPGLSQIELAAALNADRSQLCRLLRRWEDAGIVIGEQDGRRRRYAAQAHSAQ